jgi:microcystin-dependent protein
MSDQFLAEIRVFPFNFPPTGWAFCDGQVMPISQNTALFALLGTTYGGDGKSTFALPNLQGSAPMQPGQGQGLSLRDLGEQGGAPSVTLLTSEIPVHAHTFRTTVENANSTSTEQQSPGRGNAIYTSNASLTPMAPQALAPSGGGLPHNNMQPYLTLNFCIALQGIFPQRP